MLDSHGMGPAEEVRFQAGPAELAGQLYRPDGDPVAAIVLNGATGVPQEYYRHFASWLAEVRGIACLTYDYRDFGKSARRRMQDSQVSMSDWALIDQPAARAQIRQLYPNTPLWVIGHSLGGMLMPSQDGIEDVERMICVCSGLVHHSDHPWPYQGLARMFWFGHVPPLVWAMGYLPGRRVGFGENLPPKVYWQWRKWCTQRGNYLPELGLSIPAADWGRSSAPVDLIALKDDETIPPKCVWRLEQVYGPTARKELLDPSDFGLGKVGHLGAFARRNAALWPAMISG